MILSSSDVTACCIALLHTDDHIYFNHPQTIMTVVAVLVIMIMDNLYMVNIMMSDDHELDGVFGPCMVLITMMIIHRDDHHNDYERV